MRKRGDSNSRGAFAPAGFRNRDLQPLRHASDVFIKIFNVFEYNIIKVEGCIHISFFNNLY